jgi:hypothetical protein
MGQRLSSLVVAIVLAAVLWYLLQRLVIVILVPMPWWLLLAIILGLVLAVEHFAYKAFGGRRRSW